ncbi:hypothetical protein NNC19_07275 [Clostridium sp. SHJSY1]|uniref:hypothetical protein n=1 Tax=Clostridium sp. SHJSY1 TaxID=2942483 RepID=UPI0028756C6A|nr:hypothetical protein [Clostridium sp. SHJSY1]MDS0525475.1 hypothetical protein [Clostridium sp. SHJSY1]
MKINIGDYLIETDNLQFIVREKKVTGNDESVKEENRGKERWVPIGYFTTFGGALSHLPQQAIKDNDEIAIIKEKLEQIDKDIKALKN